MKGLVSECKIHPSLVHLIPEEIEDKQIVQDAEVSINQHDGESSDQGDFLSQYDDVSSQALDKENQSSQILEMEDISNHLLDTGKLQHDGMSDSEPLEKSVMVVNIEDPYIQPMDKSTMSENTETIPKICQEKFSVSDTFHSAL